MARTNYLKFLKIFTIFCLIILSGCLFEPSLPYKEDSEWQKYCQSMIDSVTNVRPEKGTPYHLLNPDSQKNGTEFDVNNYFTVLDRLHMETGFTLDYVYLYDGMGGYPVIYPRLQSTAPYTTYNDYLNSISDTAPFHMDHIRTDGTSEGFFQFVLADIMAGQFYLFWHALYNDKRIVCTYRELRNILKYDFYDHDGSGTIKKDAWELEIAPQIDIYPDRVRIRLVLFTEFGGFMEYEYILAPDFPHTFIDFNRSVLVAYDSGRMY